MKVTKQNSATLNVRNINLSCTIHTYMHTYKHTYEEDRYIYIYIPTENERKK